MPPSVRPRSAPRVPDEIREVFLSSTAKDLQQYRTRLKEDLENSKAAVFLQESWAEPAGGVVELCLGRLAESDAYLGVFGYRYGWIPERGDKSITELECDRAFQLWEKSPVPPIFLFIPTPESEAAKELEALADDVLRLDYPREPEKRAESKKQQAEFRDRLLNGGRFLRSFPSLADLRVLASTSVANWNNTILRNALNGQHEIKSAIPPGELGAIGRESQMTSLGKGQSALELSSSPGMAVLIHGRESAGQAPFRSHLESWDGWERRPRLMTPPHDRVDEAALRVSAFAVVAPGRPLAQPTFDELAGAILAECARAPLVLMPGIFQSQGVVEEFQRGFWAPLWGAMRAKTVDEPPEKRLTMIVTSLCPLSVPLPSYIWQGAIDAADVDYVCLLALPELADLTAPDVSRWLKQSGVTDQEYRNSIAKAVTSEDGVPRNVFYRLNSHVFWAALDS